MTYRRSVKENLTRSIYAGLLLGFISTMITAFMALLVWYRDIGWSGKPFIPLYQSMLLLLPVQASLENLGLLGFVLQIAIKGIIYGCVVLCIDLLKEYFFPRRAHTEAQGG